jgi:hypothetical protein
MLLVALSIMNPVLFDKTTAFYMSTRISLLVLAIGLGMKSGQQRVRFLSPFSYLYAYMAYIMVTSAWGWAPVISELKAILFLVFILALLKGVAVVVQTGVDIRLIRAGMLAISCFFILGSIMVIPFPNIGWSLIFIRMETWGAEVDVTTLKGLFNGLTWHPQTLGPMLAMLNAFLLSDYLCSFKRRNWLYRSLLAGIPVLVYMSSSRTAFFAYLISLFSVVFFFRKEHLVVRSKRQRVFNRFVLLAFLSVFVLSIYSRAFVQLDAFLRKTREVEKLEDGLSRTESLTASRMGLIEEGIANFMEKPLIGNGFQVSKLMKGYNLFEHGFIFTAPIEKGVLLVMILEEGGLLGAILFLSFLVSLYVTYTRLAFTCFLSTFTVFLGLNSGEAAFFSTSGGGGILWMICFCAMLMDIHRHRMRLTEEQRRRQSGQAVDQYTLADA